MLGLLLQINELSSNVADTSAAVVQTPPVAVPPEDTLSFLNLIERGGPIMIPIILLSIIALYIFIQRYVIINRSLREDKSLMLNIRQMVREGKIDGALTVCRSSQKPVARMIEKGLTRLGRPMKEINESIEIVGKFEVYKLERNLAILAIIAGIAPMFGFIGTIIGVIKIFYDISLAGDVSIGSVSAGLYTKMVSSAGGLIVGILSFIFYHWLNILVDKAVHKMEYQAMEFIDILEEPSI